MKTSSTIIWAGSAIAGACALVGCGGGSTATSAPTTTAPTVSVPSSTTTPVSAVVPTAPSSSRSTTPSTPAGPPTSTADVFADVSSSGAVEVMSAVSGAVVRTLTPAGATGGRDFADVGPSGRYVYFTDTAGAARVPLGGGAVQQLATAAGRNVLAVHADPADAHLEETLGSADDSGPDAVVVVNVGSTAATQLGAGAATGWSADGTRAYVTTVATTAYSQTQVGTSTVTIAAHDPSTGALLGYRESQTSRSPGDDGACGGASTATAIGPEGQIGWALDGCTTEAGGRLTYAFRTDEQHALATVALPAADEGFYATSMQFTPAGTAVFALTHQDCMGDAPVAVVRANGTQVVDLPGGDHQCG